MKGTFTLLLPTVALAGLVAQAHSTIWTFTNPIDGLQEVPPVATPGSGIASGTYDDATNLLDLTVQANGLIGTVTAAHIHGPAAPGSNAAVIFPLTGSIGFTSYSSHDMFTLSSTQEGWFLTSMTYVNIHTNFRPGGEIRGQLTPVPVPEPASLAVLGLGVIALLRKRRRK